MAIPVFSNLQIARVNQLLHLCNPYLESVGAPCGRHLEVGLDLDIGVLCMYSVSVRAWPECRSDANTFDPASRITPPLYTAQ